MRQAGDALFQDVDVTFDAGDDRLTTSVVAEGGLADIDALAGWDALGPEALRLHRDVRELLAARWLGQAAECFQSGIFPRELFRELGRLGALGVGLVGRASEPRDMLAVFAAMHALEWGDGGLRCAVTIQDSVIQALARFGTDQQRARWVRALASGEAIASFALTEPQAGSDLRAIATRARRDGDDWLLDGVKGWVTNAPAADVILVWARSGEANDDIRGFLVERAEPGLVVEPIRHAVAMRAATLGRVTLDGVRVRGRDALLPHAWGLSDINACLDYNRLTVAFGVMGAARFCLEAAITHAREREQFGAPIGTRQLVQNEITEIVSRVVLGEMLAIQTARRWSTRAPQRLEVSLVKRHNCAAARDAALRARTVLGARGVDLEAHVARHMLNLEASYSYGGTHEIHGLVVAKAVLGLSGF